MYTKETMRKQTHEAFSLFICQN
uniref:Uncharacterized protein n=1 Tax=Anguilla anguilla TaxID=7936 RepID=A0A0E9QMV1_ANGAN